MEDGIHVEVSQVDSSVVMTVDGELDVASAPALDAAFESVEVSAQLILQMTGVAFIDSTGLRSILNRAIRMCEAGGSLRIRSASPQLLRLLQLTNLDGLLERNAAA